MPSTSTRGSSGSRRSPSLMTRGPGGVCFRSGDLEVHLGIEEGFHPAMEAPAFLVEDLERMRARVE